MAVIKLLENRVANTGANVRVGKQAPRTTSSADPDHTQQRVERNRYRVDQAYQNYRREAGGSPSIIRLGSGVAPRSAALLGSMIHQMGGGAVSSAKGVFVDIAI